MCFSLVVMGFHRIAFRSLLWSIEIFLTQFHCLDDKKEWKLAVQLSKLRGRKINTLHLLYMYTSLWYDCIIKYIIYIVIYKKYRYPSRPLSTIPLQNQPSVFFTEGHPPLNAGPVPDARWVRPPKVGKQLGGLTFGCPKSQLSKSCKNYWRMKRWVFLALSIHFFICVPFFEDSQYLVNATGDFSLAQGPTSTASIAGTKSCLGSQLPRQDSANPDVDWFVTPWTFSITHPQKGKQSSKDHFSIFFKGHVKPWGVYPKGVFCSIHLRWKLSPFDHLTHFKIGDPREPTLPNKKYPEKLRDIAGKKQLLGCTNAAKYKPSVLDAWKGW